MSRSLNIVTLIGNLTKDIDLRYTEKGTPIANFTIATNRQWTTKEGEKKEETEYHRIVAWNKLGELCSELLHKGSLVYISGQLQTRKYTAKDGNEREVTEVVANDMIVLSQQRQEVN